MRNKKQDGTVLTASANIQFTTVSLTSECTGKPNGVECGTYGLCQSENCVTQTPATCFDGNAVPKPDNECVNGSF